MPDSFYAQTMARQNRPDMANDGLQVNQLPGFNSNPGFRPHGAPSFYNGNGQQTTPQNFVNYQSNLPQNVAYQNYLQSLQNPTMHSTPTVVNPQQNDFVHMQLPPQYQMQPVSQFNPQQQMMRPGFNLYTYGGQ